MRPSTNLGLYVLIFISHVMLSLGHKGNEPLTNADVGGYESDVSQVSYKSAVTLAGFDADELRTGDKVHQMIFADELTKELGSRAAMVEWKTKDPKLVAAEVEIWNAKVELLRQKNKGLESDWEAAKKELNKLKHEGFLHGIKLEKTGEEYEQRFEGTSKSRWPKIEKGVIQNLELQQSNIDQEISSQKKAVTRIKNQLDLAEAELVKSVKHLKNLDNLKKPVTQDLLIEPVKGDPAKVKASTIGLQESEPGTTTKLEIPSKSFQMTRSRWLWAVLTVAFVGLSVATVLGVFDSILRPNKKSPIVVVDTPSFTAMLQEKCGQMHSTATRIEESAKESSPRTWNSTMNAMGSVFASAYQQAHQTGIENIKGLVAESWDPSNVAPLSEPYIPARASSEYRNNVTAAHIEEQKHWYLKQLFRPIQLELDFTRQHYESIHQTAYVLMRESTALPYNTHSDHFNMAYTVHYARTSLPTQCFKFIREDRATVNRFADTRAELAIQSSETQVVLNSYFAARAELSPPPPSLPAVLAAPPVNSQQD